MCYYNGQKVTKAEFIELMEIEKMIKNIPELKRPTVLGPESPQMVVLKPNPDHTDFNTAKMRWGFIPKGLANQEQVKKFENRYDTENARGEELLWTNPKTNKPKIFKEAALNNRCLIISNQYYEWHHIYRTNKRTGKPLKTPDKYPFAIKIKGREYFYMAGIWNTWTDTDTGETMDTLAMLTTDANPLTALIHNSKKRMPTILPEELAWEWMMEDFHKSGLLNWPAFSFPRSIWKRFRLTKNSSLRVRTLMRLPIRN